MGRTGLWFFRILRSAAWFRDHAMALVAGASHIRVLRPIRVLPHIRGLNNPCCGGTLTLRSRVTLHVAAGGVLLASHEPADYTLSNG